MQSASCVHVLVHVVHNTTLQFSRLKLTLILSICMRHYVMCSTRATLQGFAVGSEPLSRVQHQTREAIVSLQQLKLSQQWRHELQQLQEAHTTAVSCTYAGWPLLCNCCRCLLQACVCSSQSTCCASTVAMACSSKRTKQHCTLCRAEMCYNLVVFRHC
jgi:hypothetical protein